MMSPASKYRARPHYKPTAEASWTKTHLPWSPRAVGPERVVLRQQSQDAGGTFRIAPAARIGFVSAASTTTSSLETSVDQGHNPVPDTDTGHLAPHPDDVARGVRSDSAGPSPGVAA
jgi:hypothetical protein